MTTGSISSEKIDLLIYGPVRPILENGFFNLPMTEYLTRPGLSFHGLRDDPEFHAIRADMARRIDDLRARY